MGISADDLAYARATIADFLPSRGTITRTGTVYPCRITKSKGRVWRPAGQPRYAGVPFWQITFSVVGVDVRRGDTITDPDHGSYLCTYTDSPEDYDVQIIAWCIHTDDANGDEIWGVIASDTVTFSKDQHPAPIPTTGPTLVRIYPVREQWNLQQFWTDYQWAVDFQPTVRYLAPYATLQVAVNDTLHWTRDGKALTFKLEHPMTNNDPVMPVVTALFKELF